MGNKLTACNYSYMQLIDYHARFYSPTLGRFIQPDSIIPDLTNSQAWNRFSYVNNSPIMYIDPSGHIMEQACGFGGVDCGTYDDSEKEDFCEGDCEVDGEDDKDFELGNSEEPEIANVVNCSGPLCLERQHYYSLFVESGEWPIPFLPVGIDLDYGIGLKMEYKSNFEAQAIWYELEIEEYYSAWIGGDHSGVIFTSLLIEYESGRVESQSLGYFPVGDANSYGTETYIPILIPVNNKNNRDSIQSLTIRIQMIVFNAVSAPGSSTIHFYDIPILVGP